MTDLNPSNVQEVPLLASKDPPPLFQPIDASKRQIRLIRLLPSGWADDSISTLR